MKHFSLILIFISQFSLLAMEEEKEYNVLPCSRFNSFLLSTQFYMNGLDKEKRADLLEELVGRYTQKDLPLMQELVCANKRVSTRSEKTYFSLVKEHWRRKFSWLPYEEKATISPALEKAIRKGDMPLVKLFSKLVAFSDLEIKQENLLIAAIYNGLPMTQLLLDHGLDAYDSCQHYRYMPGWSGTRGRDYPYGKDRFDACEYARRAYEKKHFPTKDENK